jgi:hypothetical protein
MPGPTDIVPYVAPAAKGAGTAYAAYILGRMAMETMDRANNAWDAWEWSKLSESDLQRYPLTSRFVAEPAKALGTAWGEHVDAAPSKMAGKPVRPPKKSQPKASQRRRPRKGWVPREGGKD